MRQKIVPEGDFSGRNSFPGTKGGPFELFVRNAAWFQSIPALLFAGLLLVWALLLAKGEVKFAATFVGFLLVDWLLLSLLPKLTISFGPAKPTVLILVLLRSPFLLLPEPYWWGAQGIGTLLIFYSFWIEPQMLKTNNQQLETSKLKHGQRIRVLQFGDLHMESVTPRDRKTVARIQETAPDIICFTGDFLSYSDPPHDQAIEQARWVFSQLEAPLGVYAVRGSPPVDEMPVVEKILDGLSVTLLENGYQPIEIQGQTINLIGIACSHKPFVDGPILEGVMEQVQEGLNVLMYHSPDLAPTASSKNIDLQLSGHTHGGQVRLPIFGALYTSSLYGKKLEVGRHKLGRMTLFVTRGLGLEGMAAPRVRFLCPPEIVLWELIGTG